MGAEWVIDAGAHRARREQMGAQNGRLKNTERESAEMVRRISVPHRGDEMGAQNGRLKNTERDSAEMVRRIGVPPIGVMKWVPRMGD